jgi:hypothetical protein
MPIDLRELGELIRALNPYSQQMEHPPNSNGQGVAEHDQEGPAARQQFQIEVDDYAANYATGSWTFRGQPQSIKRALRITYRYPLLDANGNTTNFYATEHLLVGYAGSDSG